MSTQNRNDNGEANETLVESFNKHYAEYLQRYSTNRRVSTEPVEQDTDNTDTETTQKIVFNTVEDDNLFFTPESDEDNVAVPANVFPVTKSTTEEASQVEEDSPAVEHSFELDYTEESPVVDDSTEQEIPTEEDSPVTEEDSVEGELTTPELEENSYEGQTFEEDSPVAEHTPEAEDSFETEDVSENDSAEFAEEELPAEQDFTEEENSEEEETPEQEENFVEEEDSTEVENLGEEDSADEETPVTVEDSEEEGQSTQADETPETENSYEEVPAVEDSFESDSDEEEEAPVTEEEPEVFLPLEDNEDYNASVAEENHFVDDDEPDVFFDPEDSGHEIEEEQDELALYQPEQPAAVEVEQPEQPQQTIVEREIVREVLVVNAEQAREMGYGVERPVEERPAPAPTPFRPAPAPYRPSVVPTERAEERPIAPRPVEAPRASESRPAEKSGFFSRFKRSKDTHETSNLTNDAPEYEEYSRVREEELDTEYLGAGDEDKIITLKTQNDYDPREERRRLQHVTKEQRDVDPAGWLEQTMLDALKLDASDLHIVVDGETKDLRARIRVDGQMQDFDYVTGTPARVIMGRLKAATKLSSGGSFAPEETIYSIDLDGESRKARAVLFRVEDGGEALVMRLPLTGNLRQLDELAFSDTNLQHVLDLLAMPYKLIMIAGPMGSGKTTTAHGALLHVADPTRTVWSIEDPVERRLPNLVQLEINEENGAGFDVLLAKLLRADYNTLFLGEIRDNATAAAAVRQAKAGRQVMSTIHADDNIKSLMRLIELAGDSPMSVLSAVGGVISQRLVRKLNKEWDGVDPTKKYKGRVPIHEILFVNDSIVEVMMQDRPLSEIKQQVRAAKGSTFRDDAIRLIEAGVTDRDEVVKVIGEFDAEDRY